MNMNMDVQPWIVDTQRGKGKGSGAALRSQLAAGWLVSEVILLFWIPVLSALKQVLLRTLLTDVK